MKKRIMSTTVLSLILTLGGAARAQEPAAAEDQKLGLLFAFGGLGFSTAGFETGPTTGTSILTALTGGGAGGGLGVKYMVMPSVGVRGMLSFATAGAKDPANPDTGEIGADGSASATAWGVGAAAEYHVMTGKIQPYVGGTLRYGATSTKSKNSVVVPSGNALDQTTVENNADCETIAGREYCGGAAWGLGALVGIEFFPWQNVSLAAEYQIGYAAIARADQKATLGNTTVTTKLGDEHQLGITTLGLLTLSFYFM
ncbi:MAG: outer membrane beta-barrel protein [Deltaproteobacteria bacterium]|nr:outer membrane beta-barrel protein [Deltaproteobacteria bacterium]